jgi:hypothetical protein
MAEKSSVSLRLGDYLKLNMMMRAGIGPHASFFLEHHHAGLVMKKIRFSLLKQRSGD